MNDTDDIVDGVFIDRKSGKGVFTENTFNLIDRRCHINRNDIHSWCQYILDIQIIKGNRIGNQIGLMFFQIPFFFRLIHHCDQLIGNVGFIFLYIDNMIDNKCPAA